MKNKIQELVLKERNTRSLQQAISGYSMMLSQVQKNLKSIVRHLKSYVRESSNPVMIEHSNKQVKLIEKLMAEVSIAIDKKEEYSME
jgi:hypothetical protein